MPTEIKRSESGKKKDRSPAPLESLHGHGWLECGMATLDPAGRVQEVNEALGQWLEESPDKLAGRSFWEVLSRQAPEWKGALAELAGGTGAFARMNLKLEALDGRPAQWFALELARNTGGGFVRLNSTLPPLSELEEAVWNEHLGDHAARQEMFLRLVRAEAKLEGLLKRWPCVVFSQRPDFSLSFASPNIEELTGIGAAEWTGPARRFWEVVHELDAEGLRQELQRTVQARTDLTSSYRLRHSGTGRVAHVVEQRHPVLSRGGLLLGYEVVWQDVTRQTVAERRLSTAAWKETLAVVTLGLAHDFRNMMAGIHALSESFLAQAEVQDRFREGLGLIKSNSLQASELVQRMISLHLGQPGERSYQDVNEIARDLMDLMGKIVKRRIKVEADLKEGQLPIYTDIVELRQAVINLMLNAADAMPKGGTLTLRTKRHTKLPKVKNLRGTTPRLPCICLTIADTGEGIEERHLASIFDPFFTTKAKGSGLGLYNALIATEKHQGALSVETEAGAGTSFHIWLPEADFKEEATTGEVKPDPGARKSLLLLGRNGALLAGTAEFLRSNNYRVVVGSSPAGIGGLLRAEEKDFAGAVLLAEAKDALPGEFLAAVRRERKQLRVVLKLAGCHQEELAGELLHGAELALNPDLSDADVLLRLEKFLS